MTLGDNALALDVLFERYITDDADCDVSVRAKEPDEVGRKRSWDFAYFDPSKSVAEGRKGALSLKQTSLTLQNRCVTQNATKRT
ncbi:hypothetical protein, partial [Pseudomonas avellanae]|uniref:hypothetical protein n=1 Tax=Pseudomonas avellanae TaxID=46257 RepID=UPI000515FFE4